MCLPLGCSYSLGDIKRQAINKVLTTSKIYNAGNKQKALVECNGVLFLLIRDINDFLK